MMYRDGLQRSLEEYIKNNNLEKLPENFSPDIEASIYFYPEFEGGRSCPCTHGYQPNHLMGETRLAAGSHRFIDQEIIWPGDSVCSFITFKITEITGCSLSIGQEFSVKEGGQLIGLGKIREVFNEQLYLPSAQLTH